MAIGRTNVVGGLTAGLVVVDELFHPTGESYLNYTRTFTIPEDGLYYIDIRLQRAGITQGSDTGAGGTLSFRRPSLEGTATWAPRDYAYAFYSVGISSSNLLGVASIQIFQYLEANSVITVNTNGRSNWPNPDKACNGILIQKVNGNIPSQFKYSE